MDRPVKSVRVGLFGIGLDAYWPQFAGLEQRLAGYVERVAEKLRRPNIEVVNLGLIDTSEKAEEAGHRFRQADVDLIFCTSRPTRFLRRCCPWCAGRRCRCIVLNLQPEAAIDYESFNRMGNRTAMTGEWLAFCAACPGAGDRQCFQPNGYRVPSGYRHAGGRSTMLARG